MELSDAPWFLLVIGVLITAHEYGHYRVALACKVKVFRFSLGFGRVLWRRPFGPPGCEFVLSAIPLGGYVMMLEKPDEAAAPGDAAHALESRPLWQRCAVIAAGPLANLLLAVVFFAAAQFIGTRQVVPTLSEPPAGSMLAAAGQRSGDRVIELLKGDPGDDRSEPQVQRVRSYDDLAEALTVAAMDKQPVTLAVKQPGSAVSRMLVLPLDRLAKSELDEEGVRRIGLTMPAQAPVVQDVAPGEPAALAGVKPGDVVEAIDGQPVPDWQALFDRIRASAASGTARPMHWQVRRGDAVLPLALSARVVSEGGHSFGRVGIVPPEAQRELVRDDVGESLAYGFRQTGHMAVLSVRMFGRMLTGQASLKNLSGPLSISDGARRAAQRGFAFFLSFLASVSVGIGVLNLLPIPVLDGGRLLYYLFEGAAGRPVSTSWQDWLRYGGVFAILLLMSIALSNDLVHFLGQ